jgi:2-polyprenyl-3-methyl-5-hydroxy-6-metoxy-1,4-benzoquinol methylase/chromosome segregation ATPase
MQTRALKTRKNYPKHVELTVAPVDANTSIAHMLEMVGERKKVLDVGCATGYFANLLVKRECDVVGVDINPVAAEEARKYCTSAIVADLDEVILPEILQGKQFDVIVFGDILEHLHEPIRTLDEARDLLNERGYVVASIPNISHGAIRLALLSGRFDYQELGILDDSHLRFFTVKTIDELFLTAGYRIEEVARVTLPLFAESDLVPILQPNDFSDDVIAGIKADRESETLQFVVKGYPLSNDQRFRAVSKRFLSANTELTATKQQIERREKEVDTLKRVLGSRDNAMRELRDEGERSAEELASVRHEFRKLEDAYRALEVDSFAKQNAALERALSAQSEQERMQPQVLSQLEGERDELSAKLQRLQEEVAAATRLRESAQQQLERERRWAATRELRIADAEQRERESEERAIASVRRAESESQTMQSLFEQAKARSDRLEAERSDLSERFQRVQAETAAAIDRAGAEKLELQQIAGSLRQEIDDLRAETASLAERNGLLLRKLDVESNRRGELESQNTQLAWRAQEAASQAHSIAERAHELERLTDDLRHELDGSHGENASLRHRNASLLDELQEEQRRSGELVENIAAMTRALEKAEAQLQLGELESSDKIAAIESACDELLSEAAQAVDEARAQQRHAATNVSELDAQLEAVRKAALADKVVMRAYADDFRQRAERAEAEFAEAIRQRDQLYLRVVDNDRALREAAQYSSKLESALKDLEEAASQERSRSEQALAQAVEHSEKLASDVRELERRFSDAHSHATSLENELASQQAVLQHLRTSAERDHARADSVAAELASLTVRHEILQGEFAESENRLVAQTEDVLASSRAEAERLATLIDTVQSSHFWKLKRWLMRLRVRAFGNARVAASPSDSAR